MLIRASLDIPPRNLQWKYHLHFGNSTKLAKLSLTGHMHNYSVPPSTLAAWMKSTAQSSHGYTHLLLEPNGLSVDDVVKELRPYFESAHADAREIFHNYAKIDLHPDSLVSTSPVHYPSCLPTTARHGIFGEVFAGLVAESFNVQNPPYKWNVPVFLFRFHADVGKYLFALARDNSKERQVWGRFGDDFIGLGLDANKDVEKIIVGEAKFRAPLSELAVNDLLEGTRYKDESGNVLRKKDGIWGALKNAQNVPEGLLQMQRILIEKAPDEYANAILTLDKLLAINPKSSVPRTDFVVFSGVSPSKRTTGSTHIPNAAAPSLYQAGRELFVVEAFIQDGPEIIKKLYDSLWS